MSVSSTATSWRPGVATSSTRPVSPYEGQAIYESDTDRVLVWDGVGWIIMSEPAQSYVPVITSSVIGATGSITGEFHRSDGYCDFWAQATFSGAGLNVNAGTTITLPKQYFSGREIEMLSILFYDVSTAARAFGSTFAASSTTFGLLARNTAATYEVGTDVAGTVPFTWAAGDSLQAAGRYRMATRYL